VQRSGTLRSLTKSLRTYLPVLSQSSGFATSPWDAEFADVKKLVDDGGATIVDVRNPGELATDGKIPKAVNLPLAEIPEALRLSEEAFRARYGFPRPGDHEPMVLHCKAGIRAAKAAGLLAQAGFSNMRVYKGSFGDWVEKGGPVEKK